MGHRLNGATCPPLEYNMIKSIENEKDYEAALVHLDWLIEFDPTPGFLIADELTALAILVENWETSHSSNSLI